MTIEAGINVSSLLYHNAGNDFRGIIAAVIRIAEVTINLPDFENFHDAGCTFAFAKGFSNTSR
jgi:hypothetical protein